MTTSRRLTSWSSGSRMGPHGPSAEVVFGRVEVSRVVSTGSTRPGSAPLPCSGHGHTAGDPLSPSASRTGWFRS